MRRRQFIQGLGSALLISGCGGSGGLEPPKAPPGGFTNPIPANPKQPILTALPPLAIRLINQSGQVSKAEFEQYILQINWQLYTDFNPRWLCAGSAELFEGPLDLNVAAVVLQDGHDDAEIGATYLVPNGNVWRVLVLPHTKPALGAYLGHATHNRVRHDYLPGQSVEAYDYEYLTYSQGKADLSDFDFPNNHGLGGTYLDYKGRPAKDLLGVLPL